MEARIRAETHQFYALGTSSVSSSAKKGLDWDLNDWKWDGDLFIATPASAIDQGPTTRANGESEKRRRTLVSDDGEEGVGNLVLNLGGSSHVVTEEGGRRNKLQEGNSSRSVHCQVEGCVSDLSGCKDYHRRHKVCEVHAKAVNAVVNNVMQRFCQQCSRFHHLQEFDEGKRSCRRRLAGHNKRRRKTHPDATADGNPLIDDRGNNYLLISLLRILSNLHSDNFEQSDNQDLLSHFLRNIASSDGSVDARHLSGLAQASQGAQRLEISSEAADVLLPTCVPVEEEARPLTTTSRTTCTTNFPDSSLRPTNYPVCPLAAMDKTSKRCTTEATPDSTVDRVKLKDFDLNTAYCDTQNSIEGHETTGTAAYVGTGSPSSPSCLVHDANQSSPPQMSVYSDSTSSQSLSSANGGAQSRTDRIVFKLFGKDPTVMPLVLRPQILDWLSHSPADIESFIRPGCIILTIYLRLPESAWDELSHDLTSSLNRLLANSDDDFWRIGWVCARIRHHIAFIYNGQVLLNTPRLLECCPYQIKIFSVTPIAAAMSASVHFTVKGSNLAQLTTRLLCEFDGNYLFQETTQALVETDRVQETSQSLNFLCSMPAVIGRGFIEVEDHDLSSCFFPFIVAEDDVCSEIRTLENVIDISSSDDDKFQKRVNVMISRTQALEFVNEIGWLFRRSHLRLTSGVNSCTSVFSLTRFKRLMAFSMDQQWCAVMRKLLDLLFQGIVDLGGQSPDELALTEDILHNAVRKNCKSLVDLLLRYRPDTAAKNGQDRFLFRPDMPGPSNITPLHIAASMSGAESVLEALIDDPGQLGLQAWKTAQDSTGFTPEDYARSRGHESYLILVQKKIHKQQAKDHSVLHIPGSLTTSASMQSSKPKSCKITGFEIAGSKLGPAQRPYCNLCSQQLVHRTRTHTGGSFLYRPAMLCMVGIAAVCVCIGIIFKGPPVFALRPFRWENLGYGSI